MVHWEAARDLGNNTHEVNVGIAMMQSSTSHYLTATSADPFASGAYVQANLPSLALVSSI